MSVLSRTLGSRSQLPGEIAHQRLVGGRIDTNLFLSETYSQIGCVASQLPACGLDGGIDLLLGRCNDLARVFFRSRLDASLFCRAFFLGGVAHHADFDIEFLQARLDLG